jgi:hypothetical protein
MQSTIAGVGVDRDDVLQDGVVFGLALGPVDANVEPVEPAVEPAPDTQPTGEAAAAAAAIAQAEQLTGVRPIPVPDTAHGDTIPPPDPDATLRPS